jgi:cytosine/adenosine deaminase-related metal-dependent hydrolase
MHNAAQSTPWTLTARWVFPVSSPPLEGGLITVHGDRLTAVEPRGIRRAVVDLGDAAILPGLVNAHVHLDLTGMHGLTPPSPDFTGWLKEVIAHRRSRSPEQVRADVEAGLTECLRFGTTLLGDISGDGGSWDVLANASLRAVVFHELLGLPRDRAQEAGRAAIKWKSQRETSPTCRPGFSPHAPYSFRAEFLPLLARLGQRIAIHLAESAAELELLERQSGPFVPFLAERGVWDPTGLAWSASHVVELSSGTERILYVHGNYLDPLVPIPSNGTLVYCPRTHAAFGHPPHPFRDFLARGVRVALGTDSLASNPDLNLFAEACFVHQRYPDVPGATLLRMATLSGAEALGWQDETGSLEPGKSADLIALPIGTSTPADPHDLLWDSTVLPRAVLFRGRWTVAP